MLTLRPPVFLCRLLLSLPVSLCLSSGLFLSLFSHIVRADSATPSPTRLACGLVQVGQPLVANSSDESTFNQIASKPEGQSKILRLLDELAVHYQNLWGLGEHQ
jgi:hypothetical protein